jgi:hypothetical protein
VSTPVLNRRPAPQEVKDDLLPAFLVLIAEVDDLVTPLAAVADQARTQHRPVMIALVEPPRPFSIDAAIQVRHERRRIDERRALIAEALKHCRGVREIGIIHLEQPLTLTEAAAHRAVLRTAQRIGRRSGYTLFSA